MLLSVFALLPLLRYCVNAHRLFAFAWGLQVINCNILISYVAEQESTATQYNMTTDALEIAVDDALGRADFNWDGMISWEEYGYSLAHNNVPEDHVVPTETHQTNDNTI